MITRMGRLGLGVCMTNKDEGWQRVVKGGRVSGSWGELGGKKEGNEKTHRQG